MWLSHPFLLERPPTEFVVLLQSEDWKARESAILVMGAVAEGCRNGLEPYLNEMIEVLLNKLSDPQPLVRIISCWAIGRYTERMICRATNGGSSNGQYQMQIDSIIWGICKCVLDKNKQVQESACSTLASVEEVAGDVLVPRLKVALFFPVMETPSFLSAVMIKLPGLNSGLIFI